MIIEANNFLSFEKIKIHATNCRQVAIDLQTLNDAPNYRKMLYSQIKGAVGQRIVEIGSGIGNYTEMLLTNGSVWATDIEDEYVRFLAERFAHRENFKVGLLKLGSISPPEHRQLVEFRPDTVVCLNVLEHIADDVSALKEMLSCVTVGGHVALVVPALPSLYCKLDKLYGHYRRYTKSSVAELASQARNAKLVHCQYFNFPGIIGWWINHVLLRREALPETQTRLYDRLIVPATSTLENLLPPPLGLSISCWVRRIA